MELILSLMFLLGYFMAFTGYTGAATIKSHVFWGGIILIILAIIGFSVGQLTNIL